MSLPSVTPGSSIDLGVVVLSSDGYCDFWPIFFRFWSVHSSFSQFPIYLVTATKSFDGGGVVVNTPRLASHPWSDRVKAGLSQIPHEFVLVVTEDLLCTSKGHGGVLGELTSFLRSSDATCLRLNPSFISSCSIRGSSMRRIPKWAMHRVSLQMAIWRRDRLLSLIKGGETPWEFEVNGSQRSRSDDRFYCSSEPLVPYVEVIGRGKVTRPGARLIKRAGLVRYLVRPTHSMREQMIRNIRHLKALTFYSLPTGIQCGLVTRGYVGRAFKAEDLR